MQSAYKKLLRNSVNLLHSEMQASEQKVEINILNIFLN